MKNGPMDETTGENGIEADPLPLSSGKRTALLNLEQFRAHLAQLAKDIGCQAELARRLNVSGQFIGEVIAGRKRPGPKLLGVIGARRRVMIEVDVEAE